MGKIPSGKVPFLWRVDELPDGEATIRNFVKALLDLGVRGILVKLVEGRLLFNNSIKMDYLARACHEEGLELHGWSYNYGDTNFERKAFGQALREAVLSKQQAERFGVLSWTVNAERQFKSADGEATKFIPEARDLMMKYREHLDIPIGFTSYKFPSQHNLPWAEFISRSDFLIPQVYWQGDSAVNAGPTQLERSVREWSKYMLPDTPIIPAGTVYRESNYPAVGFTWWPTEVQVLNFLNASKNFHGVSIWEMFQAKPKPELIDAFYNFEWPEPADPDPDPVPDNLVQRIEALEANLLSLEKDVNVFLSDVLGNIKTIEEELAVLEERLGATFVSLYNQWRGYDGGR